jgi:hypothetical protein
MLQWIQDGSPQHANNAIKIENAHQFAPVQIDPNEFRKKQKEVNKCFTDAGSNETHTYSLFHDAWQMKSSRLQNKISSGPQSNILEGVTWEEVRRMNDDQKTSDQVVMVGAASKGIIQKDFQQNAVVYKSAYSRNPFEGVTDKEIQDYKDYVAKKQRGEPGNESDCTSSTTKLHLLTHHLIHSSIRVLFFLFSILVSCVSHSVDELPEHMRHLILEPVRDTRPQTISSPTGGPKSPQSPTSDEEGEFSSALFFPHCHVPVYITAHPARPFSLSCPFSFPALLTLLFMHLRPFSCSFAATTMSTLTRTPKQVITQRSLTDRKSLAQSQKS